MAAAPAGKAAFLAEYPPEHRLWTAAAEAGLPDYDALYAAFRKSAPDLPVELGKKLSGDKKLYDAVLSYLRAELLRDRCKLDSKMILDLNTKYGEMDWRVPESQAIYWATKSIECTPDKRNINVDRLITQSLYESFKAGRILTIDAKNYESIIVVPNLALVDAVYRTYTDAQTYHDGEGAFYSSFRTARINFVKEAISILYNYGAFSKAEEYYKMLVKDDGVQKKETAEGTVYYHNLEEFVMAQWVEIIVSANPKQASEIISGLIFRSIYYMLGNDNDAAVANERIARYIYNYYVTNIGNNARMKIPAFKELKRTMVENCMRTFPPAMTALLKAKIDAEQAESAAEKAPQPPSGK